MTIQNYGVWVAFPRSYVAERDDNTPHLQLKFDDDPKQKTARFRAAINIKSSTPNEPRLVYWINRDCKDHPILDAISTLDPGWHALKSDGIDPALDYIRGNLMDLKKGMILRHDVDGEKNDIIDFVSPVLDEAIKRKAKIYLFGQQFPNGIHDVHMNQGNSGRFARDNGIWQDGGILLFFPDDQHWEAIFLAFAVQIVHTDDITGQPIGNTNFVDLIETPGSNQPVPVPDPGSNDVVSGVHIQAALVNPVGPDANPSGQPETVYLINKTQLDVNLDNWSIVNGHKDSQTLSGVLLGGSSKGFEVPHCPLGNKGGTITLLNSANLKVDGASYSKKQVKREGSLLYFH